MEEKKEFPEIPGYKIEKKLGQGGMANVYMGVQEALDRIVAIKILNPEKMQNPQVLQRFLNEARTASRLAHPNIVTIHDVAQLRNTCYIVMEYLQESLVDRIKFNPSRKLKPAEAFRILQQVTMALVYAHKEGFIHRDIKPDNILFRKDNTAVLADFGIARAADSDSNLTTDGMIIGTPHYMSPEQCRGEKINGQSDIYSLGVVLYEMLTGYIPYRSDSAAGILVKHIQEPVPQLPIELKKFQPLLDGMMAKDTSQRIQSGEELLKLVERYYPDSMLDTIEITKPDEWTFDAQGKEPEQQRKRPGEPNDYTVLTPLEEEPKKRKRGGLWFLLFLTIVIAGSAAYYFLHYRPALEQKKAAAALQQQTEIDVKEPEIITGGGETGNKPVEPPTKEDTPAPPAAGEKETAEGPSAQELANIEYEKHYSMAQEYFNGGQVEDAQEKLNQAKALKDTDDVKTLQKKIDDYREERKLKEFNRYFSLARDFYKKRSYDKARENVAKAREVMSSDQLEELARQIDKTEKEQKRKAEQARLRKKRDDDAFQRARSRNTIYSYEKYLERHPRGLHAEEVKKRLDELKSVTQLEIKIKDDVAFETAAQKNTIAAYEAYLKEYPYGGHASEADSRIQALKQKLIKETKIKIQVQAARFFESPSKASPLGERSYLKRFSKESARYIFTEIKYQNVLYGVAASSNRVVIRYDHDGGLFNHELKGMISPLKEAKDGYYWRGIGWTDPGKWPAGIYTVSIFIENQPAGTSRFEVY
jgi:serine/threonine protein kinase